VLRKSSRSVARREGIALIAASRQCDLSVNSVARRCLVQAVGHRGIRPIPSFRQSNEAGTGQTVQLVVSRRWSDPSDFGQAKCAGLAG